MFTHCWHRTSVGAVLRFHTIGIASLASVNSVSVHTIGASLAMLRIVLRFHTIGASLASVG